MGLSYLMGAGSSHRQKFEEKESLPESAQERVTMRSRVAEVLSDKAFGDVLVVSQESADRVITPSW